MVYGVLKACEKANEGGGMNEVRLQGTAGNDLKVDHMIKFTTPPTAASCDTDVKAEGNVLLHRLAAKNSIQGKQDDLNESGDSGQEFEEAKSYIISISKSANVVSKFTSFVAVDKDNREPVTGPLSTHVVPSYKTPCMGAIKLACAQPPARRKQGMAAKKRVKSGSASKPKAKSKGFLSSLFGFPQAKGAAQHQEKSSSVVLASVRRKSDYDSDEGWESSDDSSTGKESLGLKSDDPPVSMPKSSSFPSQVSAQTQKKKGSSSVLALISLQKASGSWDFTDQLVSLCGAGRDALIKGCPKEIAVDTGEGKLLWATALALVLLMGKFLDQKDEWEIISEKGTKWMKKNLPASVTFAQVLESAAAAVGVQVNPGL